MMVRKSAGSELVNYLAQGENAYGEGERVPTLKALSAELGVSISRLREQLEVARAC